MQWDLGENLALLSLGGLPLLYSAAGSLLEQCKALLGSPAAVTEIPQTIVFVLLMLMVSTVTSIPWSLYSTCESAAALLHHCILLLPICRGMFADIQTCACLCMFSCTCFVCMRI